MNNLSSGVPQSQDGGDTVRTYYGDFSHESIGKVNEMIENIAKYPRKTNQLIPRTAQKKNPHTSSGFFPGAS